MPYFITVEADSCSGWAVVKEDGEVVGCHKDKEGAIKQMVAVSQDKGIEPGGTYYGPEPYEGSSARASADSLDRGDFVRWRASGGVAQGQILRISRSEPIDVPDSDFTIDASEDDPAALIRIFREGADGWEPTDTLVGHRFSTLTKIADLRSYEDKDKKKGKQMRAVNLDAPAFMRASARQGLKYVEEGKGGGGLTPKTIREARAMAQGNVTAEKWVRLRAWIARHMPDLDAPAADPDNDNYPSPGVVAHLLWGSGPTKRGAERAMKYADRVVGRLEAEQKDRGDTLPAIETRETPLDEMEVRENKDGMFFEGYAALFDSPSKPLPFTERIAPGAFIRSLKSRNDIKLLWNHDTSEVLGSTRAGTLKLVEDERGLKVTAQLPNTTTGRDAAELLKRGDVDAMSFGFTVPRGGDDWSEDGKERTLREVMLHEVSIVAFPAYEGTSGKTTVRGLERVAQRANVDLDALSDALVKLEMGEDMTEEDTRLLNEVLDSIAPEKPAEPDEADDKSKAMLELKKYKLNLLELING
jgi:hypothetical protein